MVVAATNCFSKPSMHELLVQGIRSRSGLEQGCALFVIMAARGRGGRGRGSTSIVELPEAPKKRRLSSKGRGGESAEEVVVAEEKDSLVSRWGS